MSNKKILFLTLPVAAIVVAMAFYFLYFIKTPAYAVDSARRALMQQDAPTFYRYVNLKAFYGKTFDDILAVESKINGNTTVMSNPFALGILHMLKPAVVDIMVQETLEGISGSKTAEERPKDPVPDAMRRNIERKLPVKRLEIKDAAITKEEANTAICSLTLFSQDLNRDFVLELHMEVNDQGDWQIHHPLNLTDLLLELDGHQKTQKAAVNQIVRERLAKAVEIKDCQLTLVAGPKHTQELWANFIIHNLSEKNINQVFYDINVLDQQGKPLYNYSKYYDGRILPQELKPVKVVKALNPLVMADRELLDQQGQVLQGRLMVTYLSFEDGTVIEPNKFY